MSPKISSNIITIALLDISLGERLLIHEFWRLSSMYMEETINLREISTNVLCKIACSLTQTMLS